jgi:hypothetical protein
MTKYQQRLQQQQLDASQAQPENKDDDSAFGEAATDIVTTWWLYTVIVEAISALIDG